VILAWRQRESLLACLQSLRDTLHDAVPYEVIVVLNGAAQDVEDAVRKEVSGQRIVRAMVNLGFAGGCNFGASVAQGEYLVFLNDDGIVEPGWLEWLVRTADANSDAGAVGSCVLFPDGSVQEAGSIIWNDGSTMPVGRNLRGDLMTWHFVRPVDYASACSLLVRRSTWNALGGMDPGYHPAYYEDVDLCLGIRSLGQRVLFEPRSRMRHHESLSTDSTFKHFLFRRNRLRLVEKWSHELAFYEPPAETSSIELSRAVWRARGRPKRILIVDDRMPEPALGAGFGRMLDGLVELASQGYAVSIFALAGATRPVDQLVDAGVGVVEGDLAAHLSRPEIDYEAVIISRPNNYEEFAPTVRQLQPQALVVYDCEALFWRRLVRQARLADSPEKARAIEARAAEMKRLEDRIATEADAIVTVSSVEAAIIAEVAGHAPIHRILPAEPCIPFTERPFGVRCDIGYVAGWQAGPASPNADGLFWFVREVLPNVKAAVPWVRVRVTGSNVPAAILALADTNVQFEGEVADLASFYGGLRVAISPDLFGAGVKLKTVQALQYGVPIVATTIGAEGIETGDLPAIAVADDPAEFANRVLAFLMDPAAWHERRTVIRALVQKWANGEGAGSWTDTMRAVWDRRGHGTGSQTEV
jgi:GT2 family glycosyltransferase/glycosyltransferase involved in cell wall biosynthesis